MKYVIFLVFGSDAKHQGTYPVMMAYVCMYVCVCVCVYVTPACKHDISRTVRRIDFILDTVVGHDPQMCPIVFGDDVMHIKEGAGLNAILSPKACKHEISRMVKWIFVIFSIVVGHDPKMCPIVFGDDVMHINEGAGLNVKILKSTYFSRIVCPMFHIWHAYVV